MAVRVSRLQEVEVEALDVARFEPLVGRERMARFEVVAEETRERLDSGIDVDEFVAGELGKRIGVLAETAFISGDGSRKPLGILNAGAAATGHASPSGS